MQRAEPRVSCRAESGAHEMLEHDAAGDILRAIRQASSGFTVRPDACISYQTLYRALNELEADLHQHIHLDNNILFPRAVEIEAAVMQQLIKHPLTDKGLDQFLADWKSVSSSRTNHHSRPQRKSDLPVSLKDGFGKRRSE